MNLFMATRQSAESFPVDIHRNHTESSIDLFIRFRVLFVQWLGGTRLGFSLGTRFSLTLGLIGIKDGFHGEPENQANYQRRQQYGYIFHD